MNQGDLVKVCFDGVGSNGESVGKTIIGLVLYCFIDPRAKKNKDNFSRWISSRMLVDDKAVDVDLYWDDHYEIL